VIIKILLENNTLDIEDTIILTIGHIKNPNILTGCQNDYIRLILSEKSELG